jgi:hypothetical protein
MRAAADRRIEHDDTLGAEALGKTACGKQVDRAHAQDDVTLFGGLNNPEWDQKNQTTIGSVAVPAALSNPDDLGLSAPPAFRHPMPERYRLQYPSRQSHIGRGGRRSSYSTSKRHQASRERARPRALLPAKFPSLGSDL